MWGLLLVSAALSTLATATCPRPEGRLYADLGCKPGPHVDGCPTEYICSERSPDKCQHQGGIYSEGDTLNLTADCLANCYCTTSPLNNKTAFSCVHIDCPEIFNRPPPPNCYSTYEHGTCCKVDEICVDPANNTDRQVCHHKDQVYEIGQRFYVDEECKRCICLPGFNGSYVEPFCRRITCNLELIYGFYVADGCVPVYHRETDCCPHSWRCPEPADNVVPMKIDKKESPEVKELTCQYGDKRMQVGDVLSPSDQWPNTYCECKVPPHIICVQKTPTRY